MRYLLFLPAILSICCNMANAQQAQLLPSLIVENDSTKTSLQIAKLNISIEVTGNVASTLYDITFYNPFDRVLEGSFEFPLAEGQNVYRYGLEINGNLREGVVVEKQLARVAYENTVRQNIDPGLIEKTKGNSYRTRIYPIPAEGYKRVLIGIEQNLQYQEKELLYLLPIQSTTTIESLNVNTKVYNSLGPVVQGNTPEQFRFKQQSNDWTSSYTNKNFTPNTEIRFAIPFGTENSVLSFTGEHKGNTYFYLALPMQQEYVQKRSPSTIALLWDVSGSAVNRKLEKEISLLKEYLSKLGNVTITLIPFRNKLQKAETFIINNGNGDELIKRLKKLDYDGGTQLGSINLKNDKSEQVLLFTDGVATFGQKEIITGSSPIAIINSSATAEHSYLKFVAEQTNGVYLNLESISSEEAVRSLLFSPLHFVSATYNRNEISDVYHSSGSNRNGFSIAGKLRSASAEITLNFGYGNTIVSSIRYTISKDDEPINSIPRSWAALKLETLEMQPKKNKESITETGKEFSIVTSNTSLLVLDRVEDYVRYDITPPSELRSTFDSMMIVKKKLDLQEKMKPLEQSLVVMMELKEWYRKDFPKNMQQTSKEKKISNPQGSVSIEANASRGVASESASYGFAVTDSAVPQRRTEHAQNAPQQSNALSYDVGNFRLSPDSASLESVVVTGYGLSNQRRLEGRVSGLTVTSANGQPGSAANVAIRGSRSISTGNNPLIVIDGVPFSGRMDDIPAGNIVSTNVLNVPSATALYGSRAANGVVIITTRNGNMERADSLADIVDSTVDANMNWANIEMNEWKPDADYLKAMQKALAADYYRIYLEQKEKYKDKAFFYVDMADFLYKHNNKDLALQVLSNVAELKLEDAELMRILGYQLKSWNELSLAIETFKDVLEIRGEHPQSYRDLALANAEAGNYQEAADGLYHILTNNGDDRFDRMTSVIISEFNNLISTQKQKISTTNYDQRFIFAMPVDVRIVINWSSDDSDIDLWVSDPLKEKCMYSFPRTKGGGRLSGDITQGFGPEEYLMKKAVNGNYVVEINYYGDSRQTLAGPVTVQAELYTNYGTPQQKKQMINVRLSSSKETLKLGVLNFQASR